MIYLSTIGVYGDHAGAWVDETTPTAPLSPRGRERVLAEAQWQALGQQRGAPVAVLRLPGIYGPGRSAFDSLRAGQARRIVKPGQVFNRVHVDDIAGGIAAAITCRADGVFNITDDLPSPPQDVIAHAAALLGMPPPPEVAFEDANLTPMARSFYSECKRAANGRAKLVLGWQPRYPSYREGLAAILAAGG
jgi:nucleoside-diphosphate-sugar epimerase